MLICEVYLFFNVRDSPNVNLYFTNFLKNKSNEIEPRNPATLAQSSGFSPQSLSLRTFWFAKCVLKILFLSLLGFNVLACSGATVEMMMMTMATLKRVY